MVGGEGPIAFGWDFCSYILQGEDTFLFIFGCHFFHGSHGSQTHLGTCKMQTVNITPDPCSADLEGR